MSIHSSLPLRVARYAQRKCSDFTWNMLHFGLRQRHRRAPAFRPNLDYAEKHYLIGQLSPSGQEALRRIFDDAPRVLMRRDDFPPGYRWVYHADADKFNACQTFYDLSGSWKAYLSPVIDEIAPVINSALGTPWRVVRSRAFSVQAMPDAAFDGGSNVWHTDQLNNAMIKILVYLTPVDERRGTTQIRVSDDSVYSVVGGPGTYLVFDPTKLIHRGLPPVEGRRDAVEIMFASAMMEDKRPVSAGLNAVYPWWPWLPSGAC